MAAGDEILAWKKDIENQEIQEIDECPICDWGLEENTEKGRLYCPFCGWVSQ